MRHKRLITSEVVQCSKDCYRIWLTFKRRLFGTKCVELCYWHFFANDDGGWVAAKTFNSKKSADKFNADILSGKIYVRPNGMYNNSKIIHVGDTEFITNAQ